MWIRSSGYCRRLVRRWCQHKPPRLGETSSTFTWINKTLFKGKISIDFSILQQHEETALHIAASKGFTDIVSLLIVRGSNLHHRNEHGSTPLVVAFFHNRIDVAIILIEAGTDVSIRTKVGEWLFSRFHCLYSTLFSRYLAGWQNANGVHCIFQAQTWNWGEHCVRAFLWLFTAQASDREFWRIRVTTSLGLKLTF